MWWIRLDVSDGVWLGTTTNEDYDKFKKGDINRISLCELIKEEYDRALKIKAQIKSFDNKKLKQLADAIPVSCCLYDEYEWKRIYWHNKKIWWVWSVFEPKEYEIFLVTGKRDKDGKKIGMFGDTELAAFKW